GLLSGDTTMNSLILRTYSFTSQTTPRQMAKSPRKRPLESRCQEYRWILRSMQPKRRTLRREPAQECPTEAREGKIRNTAIPFAVDQQTMAGLRLPFCQMVERVVE